MSILKTLFAAAARATGTAAAAAAAPALNAGIGTETTASDSAVTPVQYYGCYPVYRWVHTYYGWRQVYVGQRCPDYYGYPGYGYPHGFFGFRSPGLRIGIGF
jgi:hypothetical protein